MTRAVWFNCCAGVAGDMLLAALIDAGADQTAVADAWAALGIGGYAATWERVQRCGVSASLRALRTQGMDAVRLVTHTDPADQVAAVARYCAMHATCNVVGIHLFTFGGVAASAEWMNRYISSGTGRR